MVAMLSIDIAVPCRYRALESSPRGQQEFAVPARKRATKRIGEVRDRLADLRRKPVAPHTDFTKGFVFG